MSANIQDSKNWSFETRQLHIGQEQAVPPPMHGPFPSMQALRMYSTTASTLRTGLAFGMRAISMGA